MLAYFYLRLMLPDKKLIGESKVMIYLGQHSITFFFVQYRWMSDISSTLFSSSDVSILLPALNAAR